MPSPEELICPECSGPKSKQAKRCAKCTGGGTHTSEQRDHLPTPLCGAKKRDGSTCRAFAGQGTDHSGIGKCRWHGGATGTHRKHAVSVEVRRKMVTLGQPLDTSAPDALMSLLRASAGHVAWIASEVAALDSLASHEAQVLVSLYDSERSMLVRISEAAIRAGVAEHLVRMQETQAAMTLRAIRDAATDAGLNRVQLQALGVALRKRLAEQSGDPEQAASVAENADAKLAELRAKMAHAERQRIERAAAKLPPPDLAYPPEEWTPADPAA